MHNSIFRMNEGNTDRAEEEVEVRGREQKKIHGGLAVSPSVRYIPLQSCGLSGNRLYPTRIEKSPVLACTSEAGDYNLRVLYQRPALRHLRLMGQ